MITKVLITKPKLSKRDFHKGNSEIIIEFGMTSMCVWWFWLNNKGLVQIGGLFI